ncbi:MAG: type II toxin-antitoxin system PemK/MazF family toxin [Armatimonadetes bacterium]|nr:type II toxin-antitoxin system PemK/MazF family toxin [Armatimonadota bacterium]
MDGRRKRQEATVSVFRGEVWFADLGETAGHEPAGKRPVLILSDNVFNQGPAGSESTLARVEKLLRALLRLPWAPSA